MSWLALYGRSEMCIYVYYNEWVADFKRESDF